jgi:hypothetical protein
MASKLLGMLEAIKLSFADQWHDFVPYSRDSYVPRGGKKLRRWTGGKRPPGKAYSKRYYGK